MNGRKKDREPGKGNLHAGRLKRVGKLYNTNIDDALAMHEVLLWEILKKYF